jgi:hypothetical protein
VPDRTELEERPMYTTTTRIALAGSVLLMGSAGTIGAVNLDAIHGPVHGGSPTGPVLRPAPLVVPAEAASSPVGTITPVEAIDHSAVGRHAARPSVHRPAQHRISPPVTRERRSDGDRTVLATAYLEPASFRREARPDGCGRHRRVVEEHREVHHSADHRHHFHRHHHQQAHHHHHRWDGHRSEQYGGRHHLSY